MKLFKKRDTDAVIAENQNQAMDFIFAGVKYFLINKPIKTAIVLLVLFGSSLYMVADYYAKYQYHKSHIEKQIK
jgi:hypothetical protein